MIITYYRMTGAELNRIFNEAKIKNKKLTKDAFADRIGVGRTKFYDYLKGLSIDEKDAIEIDKKIKGDPELAGYQTLLKVHPDNNTNNLPEPKTGTLSTAGQSGDKELWEKALNMLNDTLVLLKGTIDTVRDDNKFIKEDATIYRDVVKKGIQDGAIVWAKPRKSA